MHHDTLTINLVKARNLVITLLLLAYASTCVISSAIFNKKQVSGTSDSNLIVNTSESSNLLFCIPLSTEQESSDAEDDFSQEDENFIDLSSFSLFTTLDFRRFHHLNNSPLPGSLNPPFSPPEIPA